MTTYSNPFTTSMTKEIECFLKSIGLTEKEIKLYVTCLKYGPQTTSTLAKKTGLPKSTINSVFKDFIKKGFASKDKRENTTYFNVIRPESIEYILLEKSAKAKKELKEYKEILPLMASLTQNGIRNSEVTFFEGVQGLCRLVDDCTSKDQSVLFISEHNQIPNELKDYIQEIYLPASKKHSNKNKMIVHDGKQAREYAKEAKDVYDEVIFVDPKELDLTLSLAIYGNKTAFFSYQPEDLSGVIIENPLINKQMKSLFEIVKKQFKK